MIHTATEWTETLSDDPALAVFRDALATSTSTDSRAALGAASDNIRQRFLAGESVVTQGSFLLKTEILKGNIGAGCCEVDPGANQ